MENITNFKFKYCSLIKNLIHLSSIFINQCKTFVNLKEVKL